MHSALHYLTLGMLFCGKHWQSEVVKSRGKFLRQRLPLKTGKVSTRGQDERTLGSLYLQCLSTKCLWAAPCVDHGALSWQAAGASIWGLGVKPDRWAVACHRFPTPWSEDCIRNATTTPAGWSFSSALRRADGCFFLYSFGTFQKPF